MAKVAKAIIGAVSAGAGALTTALLDGQLVAVEYVTIGASVVVAFFGVWATTNAPAN